MSTHDPDNPPPKPVHGSNISLPPHALDDARRKHAQQGRPNLASRSGHPTTQQTGQPRQAETESERTVPLQVFDDPDPDMPASRQPRFILAIPGIILLLFAASTDALADTFQSDPMAVLVGAGAMLGASACFGLLGVWARTREGQVIGAMAVGACVLLYGVAVLRMI